MTYIFRFYFPNLDQDLQVIQVTASGGHIGTAFSRAWKFLRTKQPYSGIKKLRPESITISESKSKEWAYPMVVKT